MSFFCCNDNSSLEPQVVFNCLRQGGWILKSGVRIQKLAFPKVIKVGLTFLCHLEPYAPRYNLSPESWLLAPGS
jgi:hypothetical protein